MKKTTLFAISPKVCASLTLGLLAISSFAQLTTVLTINTNKERQAISPYIYSTNGQSFDYVYNITGRRLGGNRLTSYNWENNFSNAGADYINESDDYMPFVLNLPLSAYLTPNSVLSAFHDTSIAMNCHSLITLPMAGYVAGDGNGVVQTADSAPSPRWRDVVNRKGSSFSFTPDTSDNYIYVDECMNNLITQFGKSNSSHGITDYEMDNEWSIWNTSQPLLHPDQPTISEAISKSTALAATIKEMDSTANVYGPVDYGYASYLQFQYATDWSSFSSYGNFAYAYLHYMKHASDSIGHRLLDVYDSHYYSAAEGLDSNNNLQPVDGGPNDVGVAIARMEAPRTLWDSSYIENSWIGQYYSPVVFIRALQNGVNTYYPGTKLAFTEYGFGGEDHISGGIALADMLGISGRFGVYWTSVWGPVNQYWASAFKIFRNYDDNKSTFGDWHVSANTTDWRTSSIYSALQSSDTTTMNVIVMNKDYDSTLNASFNITANTHFNKAEIYAFTKTDTNIQHLGSLHISGNSFNYTIPTLSVYHFVLTDSNATTSISNIKNDNTIAVYPNPSPGLYTVNFVKVCNQYQTIDISDMSGKNVKSLIVNPKARSIQIDLQNLPNGVYLARISNPNGVIKKKLVKE